MNCLLSASLATAVLIAPASIDDRGTLIFEDDFNRTESQETSDEPGNGWGTNSKSRAGGHKQVDLRDGAMHIYIHDTADHAVSVRHEAEFQDGSVELRFMLEHPNDKLGLDFADLQLKTVHAGHLFKVTIGTRQMDIMDMKTGGMDLKIREAKLAGELTAEMQKLLTSKKQVTPVTLKPGQWYKLEIDISGENVSVAIDDKETAAFSSEGFAHPTKRMLRLSVPKQAVVDDLKIYAHASEAASE